MFHAGQQFAAGCGLSTMYPSLDWETYSEAGFVWDAATQTWKHPRGCRGDTRGLKAVGTFNYVTHPTFEPLSLAYDLLDDRGMRHWVPLMTEFGLADEPHDLIAHVAAGRILAAFAVSFEIAVWNLYCVPKYGWPMWDVANARCDADKARVSAYPPGLENVGDVLNIAEKKDKVGSYLIKLLTVPKDPGKAKRARPKPKAPPERSRHLDPLPEMTPEQIDAFDRQMDADIPF